MSFVVATIEAQVDQALASGALQEALQLLTSAEHMQPHSAGVQLRFGRVLLQLNRAHEAFAKFTQALVLNPLSVDTRLAIAQAFMAQNDGWTAAAWVSDACRVAPNQPDHWLQLAQLLASLNRESELEPALCAGAAANPQSKALLQALGEYYVSRKRYGDGVRLYPALLAVDPQDAKNLLQYGFCLESNSQLDEAVQCYRDALAVDGRYLAAHVGLSGTLWRLGDFAGTLHHAQQAMAIGPDNADVLRIYGTTLMQLNQLGEAEAYLRKACALKPDFAFATIDLALILLLAGKFNEGWQVYARRWDDTSRMTRPAFFDPDLEWQGPVAQPVKGKRVVIYAEQGLGDVINFIRYAKVLQADGATVSCVIPPDLVPLVESMPGVVCLKPNINIQADYHVAMLELPLHYRTDAANVPAKTPYLHAPADKLLAWRDKLRRWDGQLKVGIAWSGNTAHANNHNRCMPLSEFKPLMEMPGVQLFSLQKADGGRYTDMAPQGHELADLTGEWKDFADSAAMVSQLDLVISIDSAVAHLAGALGKPTWVLLPPNPDWRWLLQRSDTPWYPTMTLYRRDHVQTKSAQMARVFANVKQLSARRA